MATKSFQSDFKFNAKTGVKLVSAIESSRRVDRSINQSVTTVRDKGTINNIMKSFLGKQETLVALTVIPLLDLLNSGSELEEIKHLLFSFECKSLSHGASDVEDFIHTKAINFEKMDMARTYLVMSTYKSKPYLAGYFAIANKPLVIPKKQFSKLSVTQKKKTYGIWS